MLRRGARAFSLLRPRNGEGVSVRRPSAKPDVLRFAVGRSSLGSVLVASSRKGVAAILLGDSPSAVVDELENSFPKSQLVEGTRDDVRLADKVVAHIKNPSCVLDLKLDLRGTPFQNRVWRVVAKISAGKTMTYAEVAKKIGAPRAMRAVGSACRNCRHYFAVPCHRVVASSSAPSDRTRPGADRRHALLLRERKLIGG